NALDSLAASRARNLGRRSAAAGRAASRGPPARPVRAGNSAANGARLYARRGWAGDLVGRTYLWQRLCPAAIPASLRVARSQNDRRIGRRSSSRLEEI